MTASSGDDRDRRILDLRAEGRSYREIAAEFGMSKSAVHKAIRRALGTVPDVEAVRAHYEAPLQALIAELRRLQGEA